jgi:hypothetical protein
MGMMRRLAPALVAAILGSGAVAGEVARPEAATVPLEVLGSAVAAWVAGEMGLPLPDPLPGIAFLDAEGMSTRYGGEAGTPPAFEVVALYDDLDRTIFLPEGWTGETPAELSVLVHEMAHHLQNLSGRVYECMAAREAEAFGLQDRWLALYGRDITAEFELDRLTLLVLTRCAR